MSSNILGGKHILPMRHQTEFRRARAAGSCRYHEWIVPVAGPVDIGIRTDPAHTLMPVLIDTQHRALERCFRFAKHAGEAEHIAEPVILVRPCPAIERHCNGSHQRRAK
jgi:hypothetical protein